MNPGQHGPVYLCFPTRADSVVHESRGIPIRSVSHGEPDQHRPLARAWRPAVAGSVMNTPRSVKTLLELPELRLRLRTGADLLDRTVSRIYGTELPDPGRYVSAGEMVLSGLLWWRGPGDA